ncbi:hypothetical protein LTR35_005208 [Friedmanniomyces endolithicus]|uniref:Dynactin subunit 4 n=1 Tax=Friedmanniomyces endolithicus TaxID=329885 RepID=A0AAN6FZ32_9PEZI|nr:hypothetical protein LTR35_005208 [Friedmanniomyces endolithicus]KAK0299587.1 hypothetical protein LTS00_002032 [Friedmanniomyces endolithicus]KAK0327080.1 hypothetical protein LTR82_001842 [Friedmanniomyces endolithicus]KAK1019085.1 hypothetical protein LTR54_000898 [Friedmanniomyces endolithicus]
MAATFPYTHYACPCSNLTSPASTSVSAKRASLIPVDAPEDSTFNPHDPRANYSLSPLDRLLFCDECEEVRCQRCYGEEIIHWYCPTCLFEVPSSGVRSDGNRRSSSGEEVEETYILQCHYCDWSSLDIGVHFSKPTKITEQLAKQRKSRVSSRLPAAGAQPLSHDETFANLATFYKEQLSESGDPQNPYSNSPYSSPNNLARIMSLYGGLSVNALKKTREKPQPMREARGDKEGMLMCSFEDKAADDALLQSMQDLDWANTTTAEQRLSAPANNDARLMDALWPVATHLRTRKCRRCRFCPQYLSYPDPKLKVGNLRYKIRVLAFNHIPRLTIRSLHASYPLPNPAFCLHAADLQQRQPDVQPHITRQYILTIRNPILEPIRITLATPTTTPGRVASRVTILCPSFTVGPAGDVWDEALSPSTTSMATIPSGNGGRQAAMESLTGRGADESLDRQPEAGKVWERTKNSTSVVLEIVPGALKSLPGIAPKSEKELELDELEEGDDVLEVPIYVRAEWEVSEEHDDAGDRKGGKRIVEADGNVKKEMAFWCVLGVGRILERG